MQKGEVKISVRVEAKLLDQIDKKADEKNQNRSAFVKSVLRNYIEGKNQQDDDALSLSDYISLSMSELNEQIEKLEAIKKIYVLQNDIAALKNSIETKKPQIQKIKNEIEDIICIDADENQMQKS